MGQASIIERMAEDKIFAQQQPPKDFDFGKQTAAVFDDMLLRSVPFYAEMQRMIGEIAADFAVDGTNVYDLGCSTCTSFLALDGTVAKDVKFIGIDSSQEMLDKARSKLTEQKLRHPFELVAADLNQGAPVTNASVAIMNLTLQFIRPLNRQKIMKQIADGMNPDGAIILVEKVLSRDSMLNRFFIKYYYGFKQRNGYSELEISQKREALENVLVPYRVEENIELLLGSGFRWCELFFKWYNFCGLIAVK